MDEKSKIDENQKGYKKLDKMEGTPKLHRKASLSLGHRINNKRHSASPKNRLRSVQATAAATSKNSSTIVETPRSPSVVSHCSDIGVECTPPHKKINLDDSIDSPKLFDTSFSPSGMLSQTLAIDSPEVGWRWARNIPAEEVSTITPDSAYAADSSFTSAGSSSTEAVAMRTRGGTAEKRLTYDMRREEQRKNLELELRRAEKTRADDLLKRRCAKLQEQLKDAETQKTQDKEKQKKPRHLHMDAVLSPILKSSRKNMHSSIATTIASKEVVAMETESVANNTLNDFFNDSDSDCLLLEATQQVESKIIELTQTTDSATTASSQTIASTTSSSATSDKEKRSSLYMKFLEDDSPDDWFVSLDEVIRQATETKKPRTSFQRYKSMPAETNTTATDCAAKSTATMTTAKTSVGSTTNPIATTSAAAAGGASGSGKLKRHASTHSLSPSSSSYRGRQLNMKK